MGLKLYYEAPTYVAVSEWGFGIDNICVDAIEKAQNHVPTEAEPSQLLIYAANVVWEDELEPSWSDDGPVWQNGLQPKLVGLTNTHQIWLRRRK